MSQKKWWQYLFMFIFVGGLMLVALSTLAVTLIYPSLPSLEALTNYRPKLPLKVYSAEGKLISEFGEERRAFIKINDVPKAMKDAVLAIEDRRFYAHSGVDTKGIARALYNNLTGVSREGASTITMQVARNFFLTSERSYKRKVNEILLALKIERNLNKDQILELYLNQIYLGQRSYGFAAASQVYFGKSLKELNLAETALLAGLPKAPSGYNPFVHKDRAIVRQHEVLHDMQRYGFISKANLDEALKTPLIFKSSRISKDLSADYVAEVVRQMMYDRYKDDIYNSGLKVYTTIKKVNQEAANDAVVQGIIDYELRHGFRGPEKNITLDDDLIKKTLNQTEEFNGFLPAIVTSINKKSINVTLKNGKSVEISGNGLQLIQKFILDKTSEKRQVKLGSLIRVTQRGDAWQVVQLPQVEAAFIALDPETGAVNALVGGFDFNRNKFNHVTQAWRQPGSSFKPFVYSAALEKGFTPASIVDDSPISMSADETGSAEDWEPHNFDEKYSGPIRLRTALVKSKNMVSIRIIKKIKPSYAQNYITKFGFSAKDHPAVLSMALGAGQVTPWGLATGYAVFANNGYLVKPHIISKIVDSSGKIIESFPTNYQNTNRVIDQRNVFLMTSIMQDVVKVGTAKPATKLGRTDIAGKTGTTNNQIDAWFAGYNPKEVAIAWMGYDNPRSLGKDETGGKAALPIWIKYMSVALKNMPDYKYKKPEGVMQAKINPYNGTLVNDFDSGIFEYFYHENPPPEPHFDIQMLEDFTPSDYPEEMTTNPLQPQPPEIPAEREKQQDAQPQDHAKGENSPSERLKSNSAADSNQATQAAAKMMNPSGN